MTRRLLLSYLAVTAFVLVTFGLPLGITFVRSEERGLVNEVTADATVIGTVVEEGLEGHSQMDFQSVAIRYSELVDGRVVIVDVNGMSVADSDGFTGPRDFSTRHEFAAALEGQVDSGFRHSNTLSYDIAYVAVPVASSGTVYGAIRITRPARDLASITRKMWLTLGSAAGLVLLAVSLLGAQLARSVTRPLRDLKAGVSKLAEGILTEQVRPRGPREVRDLARSFNHMATRLIQLADAQRRFVADASHQLRTPLTGLRLRLENLAAGIGTTGKADVEGALAETRRLSQIVEGLLLLARTESTERASVDVDPDRVLTDRVQFWTPVAEENSIALRMGHVDSVALRAIEGHVEQILDNFIANAIEVSPAGSTITVTAHRIGDSLELHVLDEGPGMTAPDLERAFDRFWSGKSDPGSGLGLPIARGLARSNGGDAFVALREHGGLDASVRLPISDNQIEPISAKPRSEASTGARPKLGTS